MIAIRKYSWVGRTSARSNLAYPGEVATRGLFLAVILFIFLQLWRVTYSGAGARRLGGLTLTQMLWYLAMTEAIILSATRVSAEIDEDVRTGALATQLVRPLCYPIYRFCANLGERGVRFLLNAFVGAALAFAMVGASPITLTGLAMCGLVIPLAFTLDFLANLVIGLAAFWLEDTSGIALIYSRLTMILGGMLIPLELFPRALQPVVRALPFSGVVYGPARLFVRPDSAFLERLLIQQGISITALGLIAALVYRAGLARIHSNGG